MRTWVLVCMALLSFGCAYRNAIDRGHALAAAGNYRGAFDAYERAIALDPQEDDARRHREQLRPYAARQASDDARTALGQQSYESALAHTSYLERLDPPAGAELRSEIEAHVRAAVRGHALVDAYRLALRARQLFPRASWPWDESRALRERLLQRSDEALAAGRYEQALADLDRVAAAEPKLLPEVEARRAGVRGRWADSVVALARAHEAADRKADAALHHARAYEIAGREADLMAMRRLTASLRRHGSFLLALDASGDAQQARRLRRELSAGARAIEGLAFAEGEDEVTAAAELVAEPATCAQTSHREPALHAYVAGMRSVPNPRRRTLEAEARALAATVAALEHDAEAHARDAAEHARRAEACSAEPYSCFTLRERAAEAERERADAEHAAHEAESRLHALRHELAAEPELLSEPVIAEHGYERHHHTRSCAAAGTLTVTFAWRDGTSERFHELVQASDTSHAASPAHQLAADPLVFPHGEPELVAAANTRAAATLSGALADLTSSYYRFLAARAIDWQSSRPNDAADIMVASYVAAKGQLAARALAHYRAHLGARSGLRDLDLLRR